MSNDEIDPDRPNPEDPPIDALSMLEVAEEMHARAAAMREAAIEVKRAYVLRAIIDGHNPKGVAEACGFDLSPRPPRDPMQVFVGQMMPGIFFEDMEMQSHDDGRGRFAAWAADRIKELVLENWE